MPRSNQTDNDSQILRGTRNELSGDERRRIRLCFYAMIIYAVGYLCAGGALAALLAWRRPDLFILRGQFFVTLAYVIALAWPIVTLLILFRLVTWPAEIVARNLASHKHP